MELFSTFLGQTLSATVSEYSVRVLVGAILAGAIVLVLASPLHHRYHFTKKAFYTLLSGIVVATTATFVVVHIAAIVNSETNSIERRQARLVVSVCEQQFMFRSSDLLSSTSGTARQKLYDDGRLEYLGYITDPAKDVSLGSFLQSIGGGINASLLTLPYPEETEAQLANSAQLAQFVRTNPVGERYLELQSGGSCSTFPSMLSVFTYEYDESKNGYVKNRLTQPETFIISEQPVKTMDCIVIIYGEPSQDTTLRCGDYPTADKVISGKERP